MERIRPSNAAVRNVITCCVALVQKSLTDVTRVRIRIALDHGKDRCIRLFYHFADRQKVIVQLVQKNLN